MRFPFSGILAKAHIVNRDELDMESYLPKTSLAKTRQIAKLQQMIVKRHTGLHSLKAVERERVTLKRVYLDFNSFLYKAYPNLFCGLKSLQNYTAIP